jgi:HrpA-like RNA helicase
MKFEFENQEEDLSIELSSQPDQKQRNLMHILFLYSFLGPSERTKVFQPTPEGFKLVLFSTNVAERSFTIPKIRHVIDSNCKKKKNLVFNRGCFD